MAYTRSSTFKQKQKQNKTSRQGFLDVVFSWSLSDILSNDLYKFQVKELPLTFSTTTQYMKSFIHHLFEETRADLLSQFSGISQAPASLVSRLQRKPTGNQKDMVYQVTLSGMDYEPKFGDLIAFTQVQPKSIDDLDQPTSRFVTGFVTKTGDQGPTEVEVLSSGLIESAQSENTKRLKGFVVYLTNLTTNIRIWEALHLQGNVNIFQRLLSYNSSCDQCDTERERSVIDENLRTSFDSFMLDGSQEAAVLSCLSAKHCRHQTSVKLIWGPPGTGKTKTIASLLFVLLRTKHRTLTCAPTNVAVVGVVKALMSLVSDHGLGCDTYGFGDIVLFGNKERMKMKDQPEAIHDVFLDSRIDVLSSCLSSWRYFVNEMIQFLENPMEVYHRYLGSKPENIKSNDKKKKKKNKVKPDHDREEIQGSFEDFVLNRFNNVFETKLIWCIRTLCTHLPTCMVSLDLAKKSYRLIDLIQKLGESIRETVTRKKSLRKALIKEDVSSIGKVQFSKLRLHKTECLQELKVFQLSTIIPAAMRIHKLKKYILRNACLIFCTASSSIKLYGKAVRPIELVLIDEAAQLKECESMIPLQVPGARNVVLVGDERQLPSMLHSKICEEAKFGRSLFERLVLLGHEKHLLNVQYRMHPSISQFPNSEFYDGRILDGPNVIDKARKKHFIKGPMYGPYSFINVESAKEEVDNNRSTKNMVEVAVVVEIVSRLFKESVAKKQAVTVGCISPYMAQVNAIQAKLGKKYDQGDNSSNFVVNVRSVDGFQGGEEDVVIFSSVRCNKKGSIGFLSNRQRANVALTRARHCLWVVGNKKTMAKSGSVWSTLVLDAENRGCVYNASDDKKLARAMVQALVESSNEFSTLLKPDSMLFKDSKWLVNFTNTFSERMDSIENHGVRKLVVSLLVKLSSGWRQSKKSKRNDTRGMLETYNVDGHLYVVWSVDIAHKHSLCVQVLKFWDILPLSEIQQRARDLEKDFGKYTLDMINRCQTKRLERNLVVPMSWPGRSFGATSNSSFDESTR